MRTGWKKAYTPKAWTPKEWAPRDKSPKRPEKDPVEKPREPDTDRDPGYGYDDDYGTLLKFLGILKALIAPYLERFFGKPKEDPVEADPTLVTEDGTDVFAGTPEDDELEALDGPNLLLGGGGDDVLKSGKEFDVLIGGTGDDQLIGHGGVNALFGIDGEDELVAKSGYNVMDGGADADIFAFDPKDGETVDALIVGIDVANDAIAIEGDVSLSETQVDLAEIFSKVVDDSGLTFIEALGIGQGLAKPETLNLLDGTAPDSDGVEGGGDIIPALDPLILLTSSIERFDLLEAAIAADEQFLYDAIAIEYDGGTVTVLNPGDVLAVADVEAILTSDYPFA